MMHSHEHILNVWGDISPNDEINGYRSFGKPRIVRVLYIDPMRMLVEITMPRNYHLYHKLERGTWDRLPDGTIFRKDPEGKTIYRTTVGRERIPKYMLTKMKETHSVYNIFTNEVRTPKVIHYLREL